MADPLGLDIRSLIEVAHMLAEHHKDILRVFGWGLRTYGTDALIREQDQSGKWEAKARIIRDALKLGAPEYQLNETTLNVLHFLFPEIADRVDRGTRGV